MLISITFPNLNSIHWIIKKKDINLNVLFRTFSGHFRTGFQDISVTPLYKGDRYDRFDCS